MALATDSDGVVSSGYLGVIPLPAVIAILWPARRRRHMPVPAGARRPAERIDADEHRRDSMKAGARDTWTCLVAFGGR